MTRLYLAYGSNLNKAQMRKRCPDARPLKVIQLDDAKLVFRGVADLQFEAGAVTPCGLWEISDRDEAALDRYEGVSAGLYEKKLVPLDNGDEALVYLMTSDGIAPPSRDYYATIMRGYTDFDIVADALKAALKHSYENQRHTSATRARRAKAIQRGQFLQAARPARDAMVQDVEQVASDVEATPRNDTGSFGKRVGVSTTEDIGSYNWSGRARSNSAGTIDNHTLPARKNHHKGKRVYTQQEIQEIAEHSRKNHRPSQRPRQNLADWLADKHNRS